MTAYNTKKYIDILDKLVDNYNNTIHSTTKMKPNDVNKTKENVISNNQLKNYIDVKQEINNNFEIGDFIRILKKRKLFGKGDSEYYSKTLYEIIERNNNKFIIRSNNNKIHEVLPFQMKKIDNDLYENPYLKNSNIDNQKKIIKIDNQIKKHQRKINKEQLDINLNKQKKLDRLKKQLN